MTEPRRIVVIADDLTGAAEMAGVAHRLGRTAAITLDPATSAAEVDVAIHDTDSRLTSPEVAVARIRALGQAILPGGAARRVFKKTDSVLRGNVRAELEALAAVTHGRRVLFVPANPSAGRTIAKGVYRIKGVPLAETEFARDPHHPARSSDVLALLGAGTMPVATCPVDAPLPAHGIVVGDATSSSEVMRWAERVDAETLPAGGREFFAAWLAAQGGAARHESHALPDLQPVLVISGSLADAARESVATARAAGVPVFPVPTSSTAIPGWIDETHQALGSRGVAYVVVDRPLDPAPAAAEELSNALARLTRELFARGAFRHLVLEGGATAAAVLHALPLPLLRVTGEWSPGVVALAGDRLAVTMKPGSYPWPENLIRLLRA